MTLLADSSPEDLKAVIDLIAVPVFVADRQEDGQYRIAAINDAHSRMTGLSHAEAKGALPSELLADPDEAEAVMKHYDACLSKNLPTSYRETLTLDGTPMTFDTTLYPVPSEDGTCSRLMGTAIRVLNKSRKSSDLAFFIAQLRGTLTTMEQLLEQSDEALKTQERHALEILLRGAIGSLQQVREISGDMSLSDVEPPRRGIDKAKADILLN